MRSGQRDGLPLIARRNDGLAGIIGRLDHATRVTVSIAFRHPDGQGMPSGEESFALDAFEDSLAHRLTQSGRTAFAAVITSHGRRDYVFYSGDPKEAEILARELIRTSTDLVATVAVAADPEWATYRALGESR